MSTLAAQDPVHVHALKLRDEELKSQTENLYRQFTKIDCMRIISLIDQLVALQTQITDE